MAIKWNKILVDQAIPGKDVFIRGNGNQRTYFIEAVIRKPLAIPNYDQKHINEQLMMGEAGPESFADKTMAEPGEATVNVSNSMTGEWSFLYHNVLLVEEKS